MIHLNAVVPNMDARYFIGVDLGKERNHSALVVIERVWHQPTVPEFIASGGANFQGEYRYTVVAAERLSLGTTYPRVLGWLRSVVERYGERVQAVVVDANGAGDVMMDFLNAGKLGVRLTGLVVTGEQSRPFVGRTASGRKTVPRPELLRNLQLVLQERRRLRIDRAKCREFDALRREVTRLQLEGKRAGVQNDLAFAMGLAAWVAMGR
jgi:hypothetical protein